MTNIASERALLDQQGLDIITREEWGAVQDYDSDRDVFTPVEGFVLHIAVTGDTGNTRASEHANLRTIESIGQQRFGIGMSYNAVIFDTGRLYEGQPLTRRGAHTVDDKNIGYKSTGSSRSMNFWWRAIVLPQQEADDVTDAQVHQIAKWAAAQMRAGYAKRNPIWIGHRDVAFKACPGNTGYARLGEIRHLTEFYFRNGLEEDLNAAEHAALMDINHRSMHMYKALRGDDDADPALVAGIRDHFRNVLDFESAQEGSNLRRAVGEITLDRAKRALVEHPVAREPVVAPE